MALESLYVAEEYYRARPVSGFADAPGRRDDIVAYADNSNLVTRSNFPLFGVDRMWAAGVIR